MGKNFSMSWVSQASGSWGPINIVMSEVALVGGSCGWLRVEIGCGILVSVSRT